ncbi:MAG: ATP-binding cassette domain-containing protein [Candidatus Marinimicrobia bacterium]|nr:ATP-binding cassette domain-containing protein [Candidatus Neomarinimicrobiota bacterium]
MKTIIEVKDLSKSYLSGKLKLQVLQEIDLSIHRGDFISLMGPSGSGKSTFLNIIGTMDSPDSGQIWISGRETTHMTESQLALFRLKHIGFIFQFHYLLPEFSIEENVAMPLMIAGVRKREALKRSREMLDYLGIVERAHHFPRKYPAAKNNAALSDGR